MLRICILAAVLLVGLGTEAHAQLWAGWQVGSNPDKLSGKPVTTAKVMTTTVNQESRITRKNGAQVIVGCSEDKPIVLISFTGKIASASTVSVGYRTDNNEPKIFRAQSSSDRRGFYLKGAEAAEFIRRLEHSVKLFVRTDAPSVGRSNAEFSTSGAAGPIGTALKDCRR